MPSAPLRPCAAPSCSVLVHRGRCAAHARQREQARGTAHQRGYTFRDWQPFRRRFLAALVEAGIMPVCGAALPGAPATSSSVCKAAGLFTFESDDGTSLHFDHDPPLRADERRDPRAVCDPRRVQLLCRSCHNAKTATDGVGGEGEVF